jgi:hypothetical protein
LHAFAAGQGVESEIEDVIGFVVGQMDSKQVQISIDGIDETDIFGELVHERNATQTEATSAIRKIITQAWTASKNGPGAVGDFGFIEPAEHGASACGQALGAVALVPVALGSLFFATALDSVLASGAFVA